MLGRLQALLTEPVMGFLALVAAGVTVGPVVFLLPPAMERSCSVVSWLVVALFALEYSVNFSSAANRKRFLLDPWHILDALIVLSALASLLPSVPQLWRGSLSLRILQLFRIALFGARVRGGLRHPAERSRRALPEGSPRVSVLDPSDAQPRSGQWRDLLHWAASSPSEAGRAGEARTWLHASNLTAARLYEVATAAGVPHVMIEAALHDSSYPRLESGARWSALTVSVPSWDRAMRRDPVLLLITAQGVLSLAVHPLEIQQPPTGFKNLAWGSRCALHVIGYVLDRNEEMTGRLERAVRELEELPANESPQAFFEETFRLKRALSPVKGDLWRLRGLLEMLADGRLALPGLGEADSQQLHELAEEAGFLHETAEDIRESVLSLIDLHVGIAAHNTNRFLRLLATVSALALIPTVIGGLLGMNLVDAPWTVTLRQVAFITLLLMLGVLYALMAKGWLR